MTTTADASRKPRGSRSKPRRGAAAVELALVLPLLLTILLGVWDLGRLVDVYQMLSNAAREGGRCVSSGRLNVAAIQEAVRDYMRQALALPAGTEMSWVTVNVTNLTNAANGDPSTCDQLDQFRITVSLPSDRIRWIVMSNLIGSQTLESTCTWNSMKDIPLDVSTTIPIN